MPNEEKNNDKYELSIVSFIVRSIVSFHFSFEDTFRFFVKNGVQLQKLRDIINAEMEP